ncbi:hypothetical protein JCM19294_2505 [Nonlabens tegetincola]|uniref:Uncharacterized protein n=1 Tax=Nonlabens tegetincola TaxID=323273 RepID=A0A090Q1W7_9FLAO|nr:hypothetical protein JCM19294_2505 [Nonlabens tegetincola]
MWKKEPALNSASRHVIVPLIFIRNKKGFGFKSKKGYPINATIQQDKK